MQEVIDEAPEEFKDLIRRVGSDFSLTQGLGGNASYKHGDRMLIKASGKRLGAVDEPHYFYKVGLRESDYYILPFKQVGKPSIEVFMHALFRQTFVLHLHSSSGVALSMLAAVSPELRQELTRNDVCLLPYSRPGQELRHSIEQALLERDYSAFLLQNHGVIYFGNSVLELEGSISRFERLWAKLLNPLGVKQVSPNSRGQVLSGDEVQTILWHARENWRIAPDHCVFLGAESHEWMDSLQKNSVKDIIGIENGAGKTTVIQEQLLWFVNVAINLPHISLPTLGLVEANELRGWEAEKQRIHQSNENTT